MNYNKIYDSVKNEFMEVFNKSKPINCLFEGTDFTNITSDWFQTPSKPETNTGLFIRSLIEKSGVNHKKIIEQNKISREKTEFYKRFHRYPDFKILREDNTQKNILIEVEAIGRNLEEDIETFRKGSHILPDGKREQLHGIGQVLEWFHEFIGLQIDHVGMATNFRDWYLITFSEINLDMVYKKISVDEALDFINKITRGNTPDYFIEDFGKYQGTIDRFYKEFNLRIYYIIKNLKNEPCDNLSIKVLDIPSDLPQDKQIEIAIKYYRTNFFRLLFIRILKEWKLIQFDPIKYVFSLNPAYHYTAFNQLFFKVFNQLPKDRHPDTYEKLKSLPYLNGGLFRESEEEEKYGLSLSSEVYKDIWNVVMNYHFTQQTEEKDCVNPEVLGYIFERTLDATGIRKDSGSYYTPDKLTHYIAENTIHNYVVRELNNNSIIKGLMNFKIEHLEEIQTLKKDIQNEMYTQLISILKKIKICDSACGSGAFLRAAAAKITEIYKKIYDYFGLELEFYQKSNVKGKKPFNDLYQMKKYILQNNIYGVDYLESSVEICKLRLWLWLVEPLNDVLLPPISESLPNIDFNIVCGNSLIGYADKLEIASELHQDNINKFQTRLTDYYNSLKGSKSDESDRYFLLDDKDKAYNELNSHLRVKYEDILIPLINSKEKSKISQLQEEQSNRLKEFNPFHWIFDFNSIMVRGGFDIIIGNPPWNAIKPYDKEFFFKYDERLTIHKTDKLESDRIIKEILENDKSGSISNQFKKYKENYDIESSIFKMTYNNQNGMILGKTVSGDYNYYKMFLERNYNLLREGGQIGLVIPAAFYSDAGTKGLRELYFDKCNVHQLIGFINRSGIFNSIHRSTKFILLLAEKGNSTENFRATFMQRDINILNNIETNSMNLNWISMKNANRESYSIMEIGNQIDKIIIEKMSKHELLMDNPSWLGKIKFQTEFHMTNDIEYFDGSASDIPLYEGKHIEQYTPFFNREISYWVKLKEGLKKFEIKNPNYTDYNEYRIGFRDVTASTNKRAMIATILPKKIFCGNTLIVSKINQDEKRLISIENLLFLSALFNSTVFDYILRLQVNVHISLFFVYQMPVPKPDKTSFNSIVQNVVKLTEDWDEFKELRDSFKVKGVKLTSAGRIELIAEIDTIFGKLYGLTKKEMEYILDGFHHNTAIFESELRLLEKLTLEKFS